MSNDDEYYIDDETLAAMHAKDLEWAERAYGEIVRLAKKQETVHVNDIWAIAEAKGWDEPHNKKSLGLAFRRAGSEGVIRVSDTAIRVKYNGRHYWRPIWVSQIYKKAA